MSTGFSWDTLVVTVKLISQTLLGQEGSLETYTSLLIYLCHCLHRGEYTLFELYYSNYIFFKLIVGKVWWKKLLRGCLELVVCW